MTLDIKRGFEFVSENSSLKQCSIHKSLFVVLCLTILTLENISCTLIVSMVDLLDFFGSVDFKIYQT